MSAANPALEGAFLDSVRHALNHLYDPEQLRTSPLIKWLGFDGQRQSTTRLQQHLLEEIQALRPAPAEPAGSPQRRLHQVLQLRYEQQFAQKEVATQMGLSVRQYRRLQQAALEALAFHLIERHSLADQLGGAALPQESPATSPLPESLQWLLALSAAETTALDATLPEVVRLVQPLVTSHQKQVRLCGNFARTAAIHPMVFRQAMLQLLNTAILYAPGSEIAVTCTADRRHVSVTICASGGVEATGGDNLLNRSLAEEMVRQMLQVCGADLQVEPVEQGWRATVRCIAVQDQPVLVIDDHADTIDLLRRSLEGTRYRLVAVHEPQRALEIAQAERPFLILLDVMMPDMDGWEVLSRLKQHEATAGLPIWVCTVLDQSELALSLGADGFLRKPVTREQLLAVLKALEERMDARLDEAQARR